MNILFMGTSVFAVPSLQHLVQAGYNLVGVVSQPDRPRGRGKKLQAPPVKQEATRLGLPVYQFNKIKDPQAIELVKSLQPDLIVVAAYGQIIPRDILEYPQWGCINVHASLLPHYRGAAPIQRALMAGESVVGVTTMFMDEGLDTGDIILQKSMEIGSNTTHGELEKVLAEEGASLLLATIAMFETGQVVRTKQDDSQSNYAPMIDRSDEVIDWSKSAWDIHNQIRALSPSPGTYTVLNGSKLKIYQSRLSSHQGKGESGQFIGPTDLGFLVQTGDGVLEVLEVQKAGKKRIPAREFLKGNPLDEGVILGL